MRIEYPPTKRDATLAERGLDMSRAAEIFSGSTLTVEDDREDYGETRLITIGFLDSRMVVMVWTQRGKARRINQTPTANPAMHMKIKDYPMSIKTLIIAAAAAGITATAASADSYFSYGETLDDSAALELGTVKSQGDGVVEIYNFAGGKIGALLGTEPVNAGANRDVRVQIGSHYLNDVIAVLKVGGQTVATQDYDIHRN